MVRLLQEHCGKWGLEKKAETIKEILKSKNREMAGTTAPPTVYI